MQTTTRTLAWCVAATIVSLTLFPSTGFCQTDTGPDYEALLQQMNEIKSQIDAASRRNQSESASQQKSNSRVRNIGSQLRRRAPVVDPTTTALKIRLYDLSDLFVVVPNYQAQTPNDFSNSGLIFSGVASNSIGGGGLGGSGFGGGGFGGATGGSGGVFRVSPSLQSNPFEESVSDTVNKTQGGMSTRPGTNMQAAQVSMTEMINTIKLTVRPEMWSGRGGGATIRTLGNTLLITATEQMHQQINSLLNLFREHWGKRRTISVQTFWIKAKHAKAFDLLDRDSNDQLGAGVVAADKWKDFLRQASADDAIAYSATLTGHNNQTLHTYSGKQVLLTVGADPIEVMSGMADLKKLVDARYGGDDEDLNLVNRTRKTVGFAPIRKSFHDGVVVEMTPLATRGGNFVILDMQAKVNSLKEKARGDDFDDDSSSQVMTSKNTFADIGGKRHEIEIDEVAYVTSRFSSTIRCPKDQVILAGSMTLEPGALSDSPELFIFVRASVHTIEEDKSDWKLEETESNKKSANPPKQK